jgi:hypothetical protein
MGKGKAELFSVELLNIPERDKRVSVDNDCCLENFIVFIFLLLTLYKKVAIKYM